MDNGQSQTQAEEVQVKYLEKNQNAKNYKNPTKTKQKTLTNKNPPK